MKGKGTTTRKQKLGKETRTITVRKDIKQRQRDAGLEPGYTAKRSFFSWLFGG